MTVKDRYPDEARSAQNPNPADSLFAGAERRPAPEMTEERKAAIRAALRFCRKRLQLPARGNLDYQEAARQIAGLPDAEDVRALVRWVRDYERAEGAAGQNFARAGYKSVTNPTNGKDEP